MQLPAIVGTNAVLCIAASTVALAIAYPMIDNIPMVVSIGYYTRYYTQMIGSTYAVLDSDDAAIACWSSRQKRIQQPARPKLESQIRRGGEATHFYLKWGCQVSEMPMNRYSGTGKGKGTVRNVQSASEYCTCVLVYLLVYL